jgi:hypothetical protein
MHRVQHVGGQSSWQERCLPIGIVVVDYATRRTARVSRP